MQIITKMGSGTILKNKKFCRDQKQFFFYRYQNLNGPYLQGRVQYLSHYSIYIGSFYGVDIQLIEICLLWLTFFNVFYLDFFL